MLHHFLPRPFHLLQPRWCEKVQEVLHHILTSVLVTQRAIMALNLLISGAIKSNSLFYIQLSVLAHPHGSTDSLYWL